MPKMEGVLTPSGTIEFTKPFQVKSPTRILVTVLPDGVDADLYEEVMRHSVSPEADKLRDEAIAAYHAGDTLSTQEAIEYFQTLIGDADKS